MYRSLIASNCHVTGAEPALAHEDLDDMDDQSVYEHIMAVRQGLMSGEMPEEILQEMIEDLMNAYVYRLH